jgi:hypothetical protein
MAGDESKAEPQASARIERRQSAGSIAPFTVEFGDATSSGSFSIITLNRFKVRGRFRRDQIHAPMLGEKMSQMPDVPGIQMTVLPREKKAVAHDPLADDADLLAKANGVWNDSAMGRSPGGGSKPWPDTEFALDDDTLKTLCIELVRKRGSGVLSVVRGALPTEQQIEDLPGGELYDPGNSNQHGHPRYAEDVPAWRQKLELAGVQG